MDEGLPFGHHAKGEIAGLYADATGLHGFLYKSGKPTTIDYPGALGSGAGGINDRGDITGAYVDAMGFQHGYLRARPDGCEDGDDDGGGRCQPVFHSIDVPGAAHSPIPFELGPGLGTNANGLNNRRQIVGVFAATESYTDGFVLSDGDYRLVNHPAAGHMPGLGTKLFQINDRGVIVGDYLTQAAMAPPITHGFLLQGDDFTPIDVPGSEKGGFGTQVNGINIHKEVVGIFSDPMTGMAHGLVWADGKSYILDYPNMPFNEAHAINIHGVITGAYSSDPAAKGVIHGFVASPKDR